MSAQIIMLSGIKADVCLFNWGWSCYPRLLVILLENVTQGTAALRPSGFHRNQALSSGCDLCETSAIWLVFQLPSWSKSAERAVVRVCVSEHVCLTLERLLPASMRRSVVSLVVAAWWGCVAKVPSATLACVQIVTARREETVFPLRTPDQHSLNLKTDYCDYSHTEISTFPPFLNTFPPSTLSSFMDIQHLNYSLQDQVLDLNLWFYVDRLTTVGFFPLGCTMFFEHTNQLQDQDNTAQCNYKPQKVLAAACFITKLCEVVN